MQKINIHKKKEKKEILSAKHWAEATGERKKIKKAITCLVNSKRICYS